MLLKIRLEKEMGLFTRKETERTKEWFADNIRAYESNMYGLAMTILKNPDDAADAVQNAVLQAFTNLDSLRNADKFKQWILQIVVNESRMLLRHRIVQDDEEELERIPDSGNDGLSAETKMTLNDAVNSLEEPYRTVIRLFYYEEMSVKEIADITSASSAAVRKQLQRGREMLKERLKEENE